MLTWIMFLKFLDDLELQRAEEAKLAGPRKSTPHPGPLPGRGGEGKTVIGAPYRWRDWAANPQGVTGDELLAFINNEETTRPDGTKGEGLFRYLRKLTSSNGDNRRDVIATVFRGVQNRMVSEAQLHLWELLGGWPGAWLAQRWLRHKCSKGGYQFVFWLIVLGYQFAAFDSFRDWQLSRAGLKWIEQTSGRRR